MSNIEWLCARCAKKEDKETEPDPVVLRVCTSCKVENWVRPFGHTGSDVMASEAETEEAKAFRLEAHRLENEKKPQKAPKKARAVEEPVIEAVSEPIPATTTGSLEGDVKSTTAEPELEVVAVLEEVVDEKEAEIAALKAQLEALEK
jgi:hypothetical protein